MEDIIMTIALVMGASFTAGINLYATLFVLGALARFTSFELPEELMVLTSDWVMWPALFMYTLEFVADKVPAVDTAWDAIHSFIRIPAAALIAANGFGDVPMEFQVFAGLIGGTMASMTHITKATTRVAAHATGTSPVVSPVVSVIEDVAVVSILAFVATNPVLAIVVVVVLAIASVFILKTFWSITKGIFRSLFGSKKDYIEMTPTAA